MENSFEAVIVANGDFPVHKVPLGILSGVPHIIACDGAIIHVPQAEAVVGDGDSVPDEFRHLLIRVDEQEDNDLTKATRYCVSRGFRRIAYLGATGKREDHTIGNIFLMPHYVKRFGITPEIYTDHGWFCVIDGTTELQTFPGQQVSIFNITSKKVEGEGFTWLPYTYDELWQGTLNEANSNHILLKTDGTMIVFRSYLVKKI